MGRAFTFLLSLCVAMLFMAPAPLAQRDDGGTLPPRETVDPENDKDPRPTPDDLKVKECVEKGLRHLARIQQADGSWLNNIGNKLGDEYQVNPDGFAKPNVGVTAICCMAFIAAGHTPSRGEFRLTVGKGLKFIMDSVDTQMGWISRNGTRMYEHSFCTLLLAEVYGMTRDEVVLKHLRGATKFIVDSQNQFGAWRYIPNQNESDMSVCVCQLQALRAAANVGINVPVKTIEDAKDYVRRSYRTRSNGFNPPGGFMYQLERDYDPRDTFALTAAGIVALQSSGEYASHTFVQLDERTGISYKKQIDLNKSFLYLQRLRPEVEEGGPITPTRRWAHSYGFFYGHYYAAQAFHQYQFSGPSGLRAWQDWNRQNRINFLKMQHDNGAWTDEIGGTNPEYNAYATAMACLILNIPTGFLPVFQN
jgi:hypothetical protein